MAYQVPTEEYWWVKAVAGVVAILFGIVILLWPGITLAALLALFGIFVFIEGIVEIVAMFRAAGAHQVWWTHLLLGVICIAAGIAVFVWPGLTAMALLIIIAIWAIMIGTAEIVAAPAVGQVLLAVVGVITVLFGLLLLFNPTAGALVFVTVIGIFAIVRGIVLLAASFTAPAVVTPPR